MTEVLRRAGLLVVSAEKPAAVNEEKKVIRGEVDGIFDTGIRNTALCGLYWITKALDSSARLAGE